MPLGISYCGAWKGSQIREMSDARDFRGNRLFALSYVPFGPIGI